MFYPWLCAVQDSSQLHCLLQISLGICQNLLNQVKKQQYWNCRIVGLKPIYFLNNWICIAKQLQMQFFFFKTLFVKDWIRSLVSRLCTIFGEITGIEPEMLGVLYRRATRNINVNIVWRTRWWSLLHIQYHRHGTAQPQRRSRFFSFIWDSLIFLFSGAFLFIGTHSCFLLKNVLVWHS